MDKQFLKNMKEVKEMFKFINKEVKMKPNFCTNCGYFNDNLNKHEKCPTCGSDKRTFSTWDSRFEEYVKKGVQGNLTYPDPIGTDWAHPNSSLSRHMRATVYNVTARLNNRR
jgi:hypothetical protein